jgi:hypothetical protein
LQYNVSILFFKYSYIFWNYVEVERGGALGNSSVYGGGSSPGISDVELPAARVLELEGGGALAGNLALRDH